MSDREEEQRLAPYAGRLGKLADGVLAQLAGVSVETVRRARLERNIRRVYRRRDEPLDPAPEPDVELDTEADHAALRERLAQLEAMSAPDAILAGDPRFHRWFRQAGLTVGTAREAIRAVSEWPSARQAAHHLDALLEAIGASPTFEEELAALAVAAVGDRYAPLVAERLAFGGRPPPTLDEIGRTYGCTREWVRQIVNRFHDALDEQRPWLPAFDAFLERLVDAIPAGAAQIAAIAHDLGATHPWTPEAVEAAARAVGREIELTAACSGQLVVSTEDEALIQPLIRALEQFSTVPGVGTPTWAAQAASRATGRPVSPELALRVASSVPDLEWLEAPGIDAAFWWGDSTRNRMANNIRKVLSVISPIRVADLAAAIHQGQRDRLAWRASDPAVAEVCRRLDGVVVVEDLVYGDPPPSRDVLTRVERVVVALFEREGPLLRYQRVRDLVLTTDLHVGNLPHVLKRGPLVVQIERGVYALRGSTQRPDGLPVPPGRISFETGHLPARPTGVRAVAVWAQRSCMGSIRRGDGQDRYVIRFAGARYERWVFRADEQLYDLIRGIANQRKPPADAVALVQPTVRRIDGREHHGVGITAEMGGWWVEAWVSEDEREWAETPPARVEAPGLWIGVPASRRLDDLIG